MHCFPSLLHPPLLIPYNTKFSSKENFEVSQASLWILLGNPGSAGQYGSTAMSLILLWKPSFYLNNKSHGNKHKKLNSLAQTKWTIFHQQGTIENWNIKNEQKQKCLTIHVVLINWKEHYLPFGCKNVFQLLSPKSCNISSKESLIWWNRKQFNNLDAIENYSINPWSASTKGYKVYAKWLWVVVFAPFILSQL